MELFLVTIFTAVVVAVFIENGSCSLDHPALYTRRRRASGSSSSRISGLNHKRAATTTGLAGFERGRKYFDPEEDGFLDDFGSKKGQYEFGQKENSDFTDIRNNIPGEPGIDYAAYFKVPRTTFSCIGRTQGYYADEETGCQVFHVCGGGGGGDNDQISSFLCPVGSLFSQHLLTCDWWSKVVCSSSSSSNTQQNHLGASDLNLLVMMERAGQQPGKPTFVEWQQKNDIEINGTQKKLEHSRSLTRQTDAAADVADGGERESISNVARTIDNQLNRQSIQQNSLTVKTTKVDEPLVKSNQHSTGEKEIEITTPSVNEIDNSAVTRETADIMEGKESISLVNAHFKRMNLAASAELVTTTTTTNLQFFRGMDSSSNIEKTRKLGDTAALKINVAAADEIKYFNVVLNGTEMSGSGGSDDTAATTAVITNPRLERPGDNVTAVEYLQEDVSTLIATHGVDSSRHQAEAATESVTDDDGNVVKRYKIQNAHNISGFKINRPVVAAAVAAERKFLIYQQRQPAMRKQLQRPPQTQRSKSLLDREKIINLRNYWTEQNHSSTNLTDVSWRGNFSQAGVQADSVNNGAQQTKHLWQNLNRNQVPSSFPPRRLSSDRRRRPHDMELTVNYHTHYYPEISRSAAAADYVDSNNKTNEETNYALSDDKSQSITYVSEVEQQQELEFGSRIHTAAAPVAAAAENDNYHDQQSKVINKPEISRNAYKINSELQQENSGPAVVGLVQTAAVALVKENLPRPFTAIKNDVDYLHAMNSHVSEDDANSYSVSDDFGQAWMAAAVDERTSLNSSSTSAGADDEKISTDDPYNEEYIQKEEELRRTEAIVQTEFIASLGFDLSNDEEKKRYFNFQQQGRARILEKDKTASTVGNV